MKKKQKMIEVTVYPTWMEQVFKDIQTYDLNPAEQVAVLKDLGMEIDDIVGLAIKTGYTFGLEKKGA
jgi:hypothetical protein